jgi:phosphoglycolate phosphatase
MFRILAPGCDLEALTRSFMKKADEVMVEGTRLYGEVPEAVEGLKAAGMTIGIVSTKLRRRIERILDRHGLGRAFDVIVGAEDVARHKPAPDALLLAASRLGVDPGETLYAGDSLVDAEAARQARTPFCAVLHGPTLREEFAPYSPVSIVTDVRDIVPLLARHTA